jgi:predicted acyltransferase
MFFDMNNFRILGVLQRFAICYFIVSLCVLSFSRRTNLIIALAILVLYAILLLSGNGYSTDGNKNILMIVDNAILGSHSNHWGGRKLDSEGILSTIPCIAQVFLGFGFTAIICDDKKPLKERILNLFLIGISMLLIGLFISIFLPVNKTI